MTLLWMMGIDTSGILAAVKPAAVTGMTHVQATAFQAAAFALDPYWATHADYNDLISWFPGADRNILLEGYGGSGPIVNFVDINLTNGDDTFRTGLGDDRAFGNAGDDIIETNGGSDTLSGGSGNDQLFGGIGFDVADYSGGGEESQTRPAQGIRATFAVNDESELLGSVIDSWGDADQLSSIEFLIATSGDDLLRFVGDAQDIFWSSNSQLEADGGGNSPLGDVLDFGSLSTETGLEVAWAADGMMEVRQKGTFGVVTVVQFENVIGTAGTDNIVGNDQANGINGHLGVDQLFGGGGDDLIYFDAEDTSGDGAINGGAGWDIAQVVGDVGITADLGAMEVEVLVGGGGEDVINIGESSRIVMVAGGAGDDTFNIGTSGGSPTIVWGGEGADRINLTRAGTDPTGILVVNATGLTAENFAAFDLESLGLGSSFDWSMIDLVVINPDAADRITLNGFEIGTSTQTYTVDHDIINVYDPNMVITGTEAIFSTQYLSGSPDFAASIAGTYTVSFLGGGDRQVFAAAANFTEILIEEYVSQAIADSQRGEDGQWPLWWDGHFDLDSADFTGQVSYTGMDALPIRLYAFNLGNVFAFPHGRPWESLPGGGVIHISGDPSNPNIPEDFDVYVGVSGIEDIETFDNPLGIGDWYIVGGQFAGSSLIFSQDVSITVQMSESGTTTDPNDGPGRGGHYGDSGDTSNVSQGAGSSGDADNSPLRVTAFDYVNDSIVIDGTALNGSMMPDGVTASEYQGSTFIRYGTYGQIVLRGVTLAHWQSGAAAQILGTPDDESLVGDASEDVFAGGGGNDTIEAGSGDDRINYATGNDVILGNDVLDLRRFSTGDVLFSVGGLDVSIATAEGTILLESQARREVGDHRSNIETILFSDGVLTEADIRYRAIADQCTAGSDSVQGTGLNDLINTGEGDDTIIAAAGNDTLYGGEGSDSLDGGAGVDDMRGQSGDDAYLVDAVDDVVTEEAGDGVDHVFSRVNWQLGDHVENLTLIAAGSVDGTGNGLANALTGNASDNSLSGLDGDDTLGGGSGNDTLFGGAGNDLVNGGAGSDQMSGGAGDDVYLVDAVGDAVSEALGEGVDRVESGISWSLTANVENLTLTGSAGSNGTGNDLHNAVSGNSGANSIDGLDGNDTLIGNNGNDTIYGGAGNDSLDGGAGNDSMIGGDGDDTFIISAATDVVLEDANGGIDHVRSVVSWTLGANVEDLTLLGTSTITGTGNAGSNLIMGNAVANRLNGLDGNDTLIGGDGNDTLTGGTSADQFVFTAAANGVDVIADFNELDGGGEEGDVLRFDAASQVGTFVFLGTGAFSGGSDNSEARVSGNQVLVDTNGDALADITITLTGLSSASQLATSDFLFA